MMFDKNNVLQKKIWFIIFVKSQTAARGVADELYGGPK